MKITKTKLRKLIQEALNIYKNNDIQNYQPANKKNMYLDKPTSHSYMSGENKDWLQKGPVNKLIYDYLKSMGMISEVKNIDEMSFKGHLGFSKDSGFDKLEPTELEDYRIDQLEGDEFGLSEEEFEENLDDIIASWQKKQRKGAEVYARSERFKSEAEKRLAHLEPDIYIASHLGTFTTHFDEIKNNPGEVVAPGSIFSRLFITDINIGKKYLQLDKNFDKNTIDEIKNNDTVIYYSSAIMGSKGRLAQATPWMIFHAIFHDFSGELSKISPTAELLAKNYRTSDLKNVNKVLTHKSARVSLKKGSIGRVGADEIAEMICQDLLTRRGLVLKIPEADKKDVDNWLAIKKTINKISQEVRANLPGKFIFVGVN